MSKKLIKDTEQALSQLREEGLFKSEYGITSPQSANITVRGENGEDVPLLNMCANNYLGLADDKRLEKRAIETIEREGFGMASVRFICGTQAIHQQLEARLSTFLGTEDAILFIACFDANAGVFEALLGPEDAIISDALNHASIIDGVRLCKAQRFRYANNDMDALEEQLKAAQDARHRLIVTDGVFSMDGIMANLPGICDLAEKYDALVMVDDSHAVGFMGPNGQGTPHHFGGGRSGTSLFRHIRQGAWRRGRGLYCRGQAVGDHAAAKSATLFVLQCLAAHDCRGDNGSAGYRGAIA